MDIQNSSFVCSIKSNPAIIQHFLLPENIVFYMAQNPHSIKVNNKLIKLCKYFYLKNPLLIFDEFGIILFPENFDQSGDLWRKLRILYKDEVPRRSIDKALFRIPEKFWILDKLLIYMPFKNTYDQTVASLLATKIYRCDIYKLLLYQQILTFNEYKLFTSSGNIRDLHLQLTVVKYDDKNIVAVENLIECVPKLQHFKYMNTTGEDTYSSITSNTAQNLIMIPHFSNLLYFHCSQIPETFDFEAFFDGMKKPWKIDISLGFNDFLSTGYKDRLHNFMECLIAKGLTEDLVPSINFPGVNLVKIRALTGLFNAYRKRGNIIT